MHPPHGIQADPPGRAGGCEGSGEGGDGGGRIWLVAGTGEGPPLARELLARGWRVKVSLVSRAAALAYGAHPRQELAVGAIGGTDGPAAGIAAELADAGLRGAPYTWVIDATHPFATRISAALAEGCAARSQPLLRLLRPDLNAAGAESLDDLAGLGRLCRPGDRLLLAIGARRLAEAVAASPGVLHHARLLPQGDALATALAAGLAPQRLAPLRPGGDGRIERALCRHWQIDTVLCRRSGGANEERWHRICAALGLRLLLLERPGEPARVEALPLEDLLDQLGESGSGG
ncbi:precorrin-6A/cobalt-precorrin-6A reductase [Synechococcus sp. CCAP 1479/9]|uniref:precorrin-6A/cobalt-precorrin-6A reductase n=1 Tax=Synechococcus sp. CCAP 1479/9 TaxID=1221593 RepID=UPI001C2384D3|nr:precorrin-6A/cobalt-precorrin-6A reductase [Synechococcus sp. CCAP 1479/9]